jgi:nucleoside-diphosphate-sugar epimerase
MKRVLVTGASGFVGRHALAPLAARGFEVHTAGRTACPAAIWHESDLLAPGEAERVMAEVKPSHLLHLAWDATPGSYWTSDDNLRWTATSLALLLAFQQQGGSRAVMAGTCAEYDWSHEVLSETATPLRPRLLYGTCKDALRRAAESFCAQHGVSFAWGRLFYLYGPGEKTGRLVPLVVNTLSEGRELAFSEGRLERDFLHTADAGDAFAALLDSDVSGAVNIASGETVTLRSVVERLAAALGKSNLVRFGARPEPVGEPLRLAADVTRLRGEVAWTPTRTLEAGLADVLKTEITKAKS